MNILKKIKKLFKRNKKRVLDPRDAVEWLKKEILLSDEPGLLVNPKVSIRNINLNKEEKEIFDKVGVVYFRGKKGEKPLSLEESEKIFKNTLNKYKLGLTQDKKKKFNEIDS